MTPTFSNTDKEDVCAHRPTLTTIVDRYVWEGRVRTHSLKGNMNLESFPECFWGKCIIVHGQGSQWGWQPHSHRHQHLSSSKFPLSNQFIAMNKLYSDLLDWILTSQANKQAINSRALGLLLLQLTVHFHSTNLLKLKTECFGKRRIKPLAPVKDRRVGKCSSRWHDGIPAGLPLEGSLSSSLLTVRVKEDKEDSGSAYHAFDWWSLITLSLPGLPLGISWHTGQRPSPPGLVRLMEMADGDLNNHDV